jgi:transcription elongation factor GreA
MSQLINKVPMTTTGAELLKAELHKLKTVERPAVITAISEARAHGDLKENAEYSAAKERQSFIEGRISELEAKLANAQIINPIELKHIQKIVFGATVTLANEEDEHTTYQIVGDDEADIKAGKISVNSPIARALIGKTPGDIAQVKTPSGEQEYEIIEVVYK